MWIALPASGQNLQQRIDDTRMRQAASAGESLLTPQPLSVDERLGEIIHPARIEGPSAQIAFEWWSNTTGIPLVIDWQAMALEGVDGETPIDLNLQYVPARQFLQIMMQMVAPDTQLVYDVAPWYVQVMTKEQANRQTVLKVYDVSDLTVEVPNFTDAPRFDLVSALSNTTTGGSGSGVSIFDEDDTEREPRKSKTERGQDLAQLIRNTIEPGIWQAHGGQYASVSYTFGRLIVNAPNYVHRQIGIPVVSRPVPVLHGGPGGDRGAWRKARPRSSWHPRGVSGIGPASRVSSTH